MKKILKSIMIFAGIVLLLSACEDFTKLTAPPINTGTADFSRFVVIGNSLTAGYQSGALFESAQKYSYGNLIAKQVGTTFEQPIVSDPGFGSRLEIQSLDPFTLVNNPNMGIPQNLNYPLPYNNLGIPDALLYDVLNATSSTTCASYVFGGVPNPMFDLILRNSDTTATPLSQFQQAAALQPTTVILWIGNNDVLGFATSGGTSPTSPTDLNVFEGLYNATAGAIASLGANVVVANIPNVSAIPFFTTVGPQIAMGVPWYQLAALGVPGLFYQEHGNVGPSQTFADSLTLLTGGVLVTLKGSSYASLIGQPTGKFYRDFGFPALPPGIDTTQAFGVHPLNPWPDAFILDPGEINTVQTATVQFNDIISSAAETYGFGLADMFSFFNQIRMNDFTGGTVFDGITFTTFYVVGGLFSLDGVHPTNQGYAIVANEFIKVFNSKFGANIPLIDVSTIPGSLNFTGKVRFENGFAQFPKGAFDHLFF